MWRRKPAHGTQDRTTDAVSGIGDILRRRRLTLGLSLEEIHERIRVPVRFLEAIEADRFEAFGVAQYAKGFVRSYAQFLGLDPDPFVARVRAQAVPGSRTKLVASGEVPIRPTAPRSPLRRALMWAVAIAGLFVLSVGYIGYQQIRQFYQSGASRPAIGVVAEESAATGGPGQPARAPAAMPDGGPALPAQDAAADSAVRIEMRGEDVSWVSVTADGNVVFEGFLRAGERQSWEAANALNVVIGNAAAVRVQHNGRDLGSLGAEGEVVRRTFSRGRPAQERSP